MRNRIISGAITVLWLSAAACTHKTQDLQPEATCIADTIQTVSFSRNIIPIFKNNCTQSGCHTGTDVTAAGHLSLDSAVAYTELSKAGSGYINTVQPEASLIYAQLLSTADPMPPGAKLDNCSLSLILKWLQQNALNN